MSAMDRLAETPCRFLEVEASGALVLQIGAERVRTTLRGARIDPSKAAPAHAFLSERFRSIRLRCMQRAPGSPASMDVEFFAWQDKSGDVWENLGAVLIDEGLAEPHA